MMTGKDLKGEGACTQSFQPMTEIVGKHVFFDAQQNRRLETTNNNRKSVKN